MAATPGLLLAGRYRLANRIAVGGMGEVWSANDSRLSRTVAVKVLRPELSGDQEFVNRFRAEARITASLNHPGIAAVYDYGEVASIPGGPLDTAYLVMELVAGEPLSAVLARMGRLSGPRTLDLLEQCGRALQVAHGRALVHRDIKPGNILITAAGQVKVTDFGIAKAAHDVPVTRSGTVMGTAAYLSPEQALGADAVPASDVYALGVVAFECLAGARPFSADNPVAVVLAQINASPPPLPGDVPPTIGALVFRMLEKDPARRFASGGELALAAAAVRSPSRLGSQSGSRSGSPSGVVAGTRAAAGSAAGPAASRVYAAPGHAVTPGYAVSNHPAAPGYAVSNRAAAPGYAVSNHPAAPGYAVSNRAAAPGYAAANPAARPAPTRIAGPVVTGAPGTPAPSGYRAGRPAGGQPAGTRQIRRRTGVATVIAVIVLLAGAVAGLIVYRSTGATPVTAPLVSGRTAAPDSGNLAHFAGFVGNDAAAGMEQWAVVRGHDGRAALPGAVLLGNVLTTRDEGR